MTERERDSPDELDNISPTTAIPEQGHQPDPDQLANVSPSRSSKREMNDPPAQLDDVNHTTASS